METDEVDQPERRTATPRAYRRAALAGSGARRRSSTVAERVVTYSAAAVAAVVTAATTPAAPTGLPFVDAVQCAAVAPLVIVAGTRARRWSLIVGAAVVTAGSTGVAQLGGAIALATVVSMVWLRRRQRAASTVVAALVALVSFHLDVGGPSGVETLLGLAATVPVLASGYRYLPRRQRSTLRRVGWGLGALAVVLVVLSGLAALGVSERVQHAVRLTREGIAEAQDGDGTAAADRFEDATKEFAAADERLGAWWAGGARLVPAAGRNLAAVQEAVHLGVELTATARTVTVDLDFDRVQRPDGGVDLAVLESYEEPVRESVAALRSAADGLASARSPWLVPPLRDRLDDLAREVEDLEEQTDAASIGVEDGPALLGGDSPRRYLFLLANPAELRDLGGHIGNWVEVVADDGRLTLAEVGGPLDLSVPAPEAPTWVAADFPPSYAVVKPALYPQNWGANPDVPTVTRLAARLFENATGRAVDGVVYADSRAFAELVGVGGSIRVPGLDGFELTEQNAERFLVRDQYELFPTEEAAGAALESVIEELFERLTTSALPGPRSLGERFGTLVRSGRFQMSTLHGRDTRLLERFGLRGEVPDPGGHDLLGVLQRNANPSKIDSFLRRSTRVNVEWDPQTGQVASVVTVELHNDAPPSGLSPLVIGNAAHAPPGTNVTDLTVLTPFDLRSVLVDGVRSASQPLREERFWRHTVRVAIPPGGSTTVDFHLRGEVRAGQEYRMDLVGQPILGDNDLAVGIHGVSGSMKVDGTTREIPGSGRIELDSDFDAVLSWQLAR